MKNFRISRDAIYYQFTAGIDTNAARVGDLVTACKDAKGWHLKNSAGVWYFCPLATLRAQLSAALEIVRTETAPKISTEKKPDQETTTNPDQAQKEAPKAYAPDTIKLYHICYDGLMSGWHKISPDRLGNFTLEFFADFLECAKRSARLGVASYEPIFNSLFYTVSGSEYCQFLEVFYSLDYWRSLLEDAKTKKAIKAFKNFILSDDADIATLHTELIKIFGDLETADRWKYNQIGRLPEGVNFSDYVLRA